MGAIPAKMSRNRCGSSSSAASNSSAGKPFPKSTTLEVEEVLIDLETDLEIELKDDMARARDLVMRYEVAVLGDDAEKSAEARDELTAIVLASANPDPKKLEAFADKQVERDNFIAAALFVQVAADIFARENGQLGASGLSDCGVTLQHAAAGLIDMRGDSKRAVKNHLLPVLDSLREKIRALGDADEEVRVTCEADCYNCSALILLLSGENEMVERTSRLGLELMESRLTRAECAQYEIYGGLLHNLGSAYGNMGRVELAVRHFERAVAAFETATNFHSPEEKQEAIRHIRRLIRQASKQKSKASERRSSVTCVVS